MDTRKIKDTLDSLIVALCADYPRRADRIREGSLPHATEMEYKYLNYKIYDAAAEVVGERLAEIYVLEIGERTGYAASRIDSVSESTYKIAKNRIKGGIKRKLHLCT